MPHGGSPAARSGVSTTDHREGKAERDDGVRRRDRQTARWA